MVSDNCAPFELPEYLKTALSKNVEERSTV